MRYCQNCGAELENDDDSICKQCHTEEESTWLWNAEGVMDGAIWG